MKKTNGPGIARRALLAGFLPAAAGFALVGGLRLKAGAAEAKPLHKDPAGALAALEGREGGRLGVSVLNTADGSRFGYRQDEIFALCSTFKLVLAATILAQVDAGGMTLEQRLPVAKADIVGNSPVTEKHVGETMTVGELCRATVAASDNAAANLLLAVCGGPEAITAYVRSVGDTVTRLDRTEPAMNNLLVAGGDDRDTTSPAAMAATMQTVLLGDVLSPASRAILIDWLKATDTGPDRLRRGFPADWVMGHKTGTGQDGPTNDIAIAWPPGRAPVIVTAYYDRKGRTMKENATVLAEVGRIVGIYA